MLDYVDSLQNFLAGYVVAAIGYLCSALNMFNIKQISAIRRVLYLTAIPGMMFYQIGKWDPSKKVWSSLLVGFLVQITLHLLFALISWIFPFSNHKSRFLISIFAVTHCDFLMFGSPLAQYLWDPSNYIYVSAILSICEFFIITPIHSILTFHITPIGHITNSDSEEEYDVDSHSIHTAINDQNDHIDDTDNINNHGNSHNENMNTELDEIDRQSDGNPTFESSHSDNNLTSQSENNQKKRKENSEEEKDRLVKLEIFKPYVPNEKLEELKNASLLVETSFKRHVIFSYVNAINIATIIGIIWSFCPWGMFKLVDEFAGDLSKAVAGVGMFLTGCFMWEHPFAGCNWIEVIIYFIIHSFGVPFLALLFCYCLGIDSDISRVIVLMHAMPVSLTGYILGRTSGQGMQAASFTWFYTNLLSFPLQMLWTVIINNIGFLN